MKRETAGVHLQGFKKSESGGLRICAGEKDYEIQEREEKKKINRNRGKTFSGYVR